MKNEYLKLRVLRFFFTIFITTLILLPGYFLSTNYYLIIITGLAWIHFILYIKAEKYFSPIIIIFPSLKVLPEYKWILQKKKKITAGFVLILFSIRNFLSIDTNWAGGSHFNFNFFSFIILVFIVVIVIHMINIYVSKDVEDNKFI